MIHFPTQHQLLRYSATLNLSQFLWDLPPPAKESSIVDATQNKPYQETQQQDGITVVHPSRKHQSCFQVLYLSSYSNKTSRTSLWEILEFPKYFPKNLSQKM